MISGWIIVACVVLVLGFVLSWKLKNDDAFTNALFTVLLIGLGYYWAVVQ